LSLLLTLIVLNGILAMSEIAIVGSKRTRLLQMAEGGKAGARRALALAAEPTRFLSSVQVGITAIGILSGAIGEASIAARLGVWFERVPALADYADTLSLAIMVLAVTYVSLIVGELAPKRLALARAETIASAMSRPLELLAWVGRPLVHLLSVSTDSLVGLAGIPSTPPQGVSIEEIKVLLEQGAEEGVVESAEHEMMTNVLNLDERLVAGVLTPRGDVVFLELRDATEVHRDKLRAEPHSVLPLCDGGLDNVVGVVRATRVLDQLLEGRTLDLTSLAEPALFVPETVTLMRLLEQFKRTHLPVALVVDEFGAVQGLVSLTDITSAIVGDLPAETTAEPLIVPREDGSWLIDGGLDLDALVRTLDASALVSAEERQHAHTLGGLAMFALGHVPRIGDIFERGGFRLEIVDMDGNRVDRVLVQRTAPPPGAV